MGDYHPLPGKPSHKRKHHHGCGCEHEKHHCRSLKRHHHHGRKHKHDC